MIQKTPLKVQADLRDLGNRPLDALRLLLLADVLHRVAENLTGTSVTTITLGGSAVTGRLRPTLSKLGIPMPCPGRPVDQEDEGATAVVLRPATRDRGPTDSGALAVGTVTPTSLDALHHLKGRDPLILRLALLRIPWGSPAMLSGARMHRAEETLLRWRFKVAGWKDAPVAPPNGLDELHAVLTENLDTATALRLLHRLESDLHIASGAKFATFTDLDRILGLDLRRPVLPWG